MKPKIFIIASIILILLVLLIAITINKKEKLNTTSSKPSQENENIVFLIDNILFEPKNEIAFQISQSETNEKTIAVTNNNSREVVLECLGSSNTELKESEPSWNCYTTNRDPHNRITLKPQETGYFNIYLDTNQNTSIGMHKLDVMFDAGIQGQYETRFEMKRKNIFFNINVTKSDTAKQESADDKFCKLNPDFCSCLFSCGSYKYCNDKIVVICKNCGEEEEGLLAKTFEYQNEVYSCLYQQFNIKPKYPPIRYRISLSDTSMVDEGSSTLIMGKAGACDIINTGFFGWVYGGEKRVANITNLRAEVHETAHIFTNSIASNVPEWFNEAVSIYAEARLKCHPQQSESPFYMDNSSYEYTYLPLKNKDMSNFHTLLVIGEAHYIANLFDTALEREYDCNVNCMFEIVRKLENYCLNFKDCNIDNRTIKLKAEEVTGKDLSQLFDLLNIDLNN